MKTRILNRAFALIVSVALLVLSVPAQDALGPHRLVALPAPTLGGTVSLGTVFRGGRPMLGYLMGTGGVAFDGVAAPANGLSINTLDLSYSAVLTDGKRMSLSINGRSAATDIYDWQLIPIARFANSDTASCVTLFGHFTDPQLEAIHQMFGGYVVNYHPSFKDTLVGLRLFQLDDLIIDEWSRELPKEKGQYLLGAGESAPGKENEVGWKQFDQYHNRHKALFESAVSYLICDRDQLVTFDTRGGKLNITGEPFYSFWGIDTDKYEDFTNGAALDNAKSALTAELRRAGVGRALAAQKAWLITQIQTAINSYETRVNDRLVLEQLGYSELLDLLNAKATARGELLRRQSIPFLKNRLAELRTLQDMPIPRDITELNQMVAQNIAMLRAINPAVWDTGVAVMRYAAFFRYVKEKHPAQWQSFMAQIERAPTPQPKVVTPTIY